MQSEIHATGDESDLIEFKEVIEKTVRDFEKASKSIKVKKLDTKIFVQPKNYRRQKK